MTWAPWSRVSGDSNAERVRVEAFDERDPHLSAVGYTSVPAYLAIFRAWDRVSRASSSAVKSSSFTKLRL